MPLGTAKQRLSSLDHEEVWSEAIPIPDGVIDTYDRIHCLWSYMGINRFTPSKTLTLENRGVAFTVESRSIANTLVNRSVAYTLEDRSVAKNLFRRSQSMTLEST